MSRLMQTELKRLTREGLAALAKTTASPCVTLLMPTYRSGRETMQGGPRLKNLIDKAEQVLEARGYSADLLAPLHPLTDGDAEFWQHQGEGLAIFLADDEVQMYQLPQKPEENVVVDTALYLKPLAGRQSDSCEATVLTISWDRSELFKVAADSIEKADGGPFPIDFDDVVLPRDPEEQLQYRSHKKGAANSADGTAMYHGHGEGEEKLDADRRQYLQQIGEHLASFLYGSDASLVVVGTEEVVGHFSAVCEIPIETRLHGSPSELTQDEIRQRTVAAIETPPSHDADTFAERFGNASASSKATTEIGETLRASVEGRIDTLWVARDRAVHGKFDASESKVEITDRPHDADLVNRSVIETLKHGGDVYACEAANLPKGCDVVAAICRY